MEQNLFYLTEVIANGRLVGLWCGLLLLSPFVSFTLAKPPLLQGDPTGLVLAKWPIPIVEGLKLYQVATRCYPESQLIAAYTGQNLSISCIKPYVVTL